jgi:hypothetical protein
VAVVLGAAQSNKQVRTGKETVVEDHTVLEQIRRKSLNDNCRYSPDSKRGHSDVKSKVLPLVLSVRLSFCQIVKAL